MSEIHWLTPHIKKYSKSRTNGRCQKILAQMLVMTLILEPFVLSINIQKLISLLKGIKSLCIGKVILSIK